MHFTAVNGDACKDIECAVCLEPWDDPVEIDACRHVFCRSCSRTLQRCPDCRQQIKGLKAPNRILANLANAAAMRCETCHWTGTREASRSHRCSTGHAPAMPQQQQPPHPAPAPQVPVAAPAPAAYQRFQPRSTASGPWERFHLEQEEYDHIFAVFMTFDTDGSGELDRAELKTLCRWLNYAHTDRDVENMFRAMDTDGSGALSMDEFCGWISTHRPDPQALYGLTPVEYNNVLFQFHTFDTDQNGSLDENEFVGLAIRQGYATHEAAARHLFRMIDTDRSGTVDLHELLTFRAQQRHGSAPLQQPPQPSPGASWGPPQSMPPQQQYQLPPQQYYPAPAPYGERPRYDGPYAAPAPAWHPQAAPQPQPTSGYPPGAYPQRQPLPQQQPPQPPQQSRGSKKKDESCVVA